MQGIRDVCSIGQFYDLFDHIIAIHARSQERGENRNPLEESIYMLETGMNEQMRRGELRAKRNLLFERFSKNPSEIHLAIEIKSIDDQVAESLFIATDKEPCQRKQSLPPRTITGTPMEQIQKSSHAKLPFAISPG
jgi:hypothetical protein